MTFVDFLREKGLNENTIKVYNRSLLIDEDGNSHPSVLKNVRSAHKWHKSYLDSLLSSKGVIEDDLNTLDTPEKSLKRCIDLLFLMPASLEVKLGLLHLLISGGHYAEDK